MYVLICTNIQIGHWHVFIKYILDAKNIQSSSEQSKDFKLILPNIKPCHSSNLALNYLNWIHAQKELEVDFVNVDQEISTGSIYKI